MKKHLTETLLSAIREMPPGMVEEFYNSLEAGTKMVSLLKYLFMETVFVASEAQRRKEAREETDA